MSDCRFVIAHATSYVDDLIEADRRVEIERHLESCASCRVTVATERGGQTVLRHHASRLREEPRPEETLPPGLRSRCESIVGEQAKARSGRIPGWQRSLVPTVLSVILLVFTASAIFSLATRQSDAVLAAQLTADHSKCFKLFVGGDSSMSAAGGRTAPLAAVRVEDSRAAVHQRVAAGGRQAVSVR